jgi:branched-chain amino acid transport system substrate-binding protein
MLRKSSMIVLATTVLGVGCAHAQIKIGITMSGSGPGAALGQPQTKTVAVLPKEIAGQKITYFALDDESDPTKGAQNARKLITGEKIDVLIGSSLTTVSLPLIDIAAESRTPLVSLASAAAMVAPMDDKRKWVFKVVPNDDIMANAILKYIVRTGIKSLGYIGVSDAYGEGYYNVLSEAAPKLGITLTGHEVYARSDASVTGQVLKVLATKPDAVFIASSGTPAVLPQKALRERGYKGPIFQTHGASMEEFIKLGGKDVDGAIFAGEAFTVVNDLPADSPFRKTTAAFVDAYKAVNGNAPSIFGAHLYDAMSLVERAIPAALKVAKPGTEEFRAALRNEIEKTKDLALNNGLSNMSPENHNGYDERSAFVIEIKDGSYHLVK